MHFNLSTVCMTVGVVTQRIPHWCRVTTKGTADISRRQQLFPAEISFWWRVTTQIWVVLLIGCAEREICFNQSDAPRSTQIWVMTLNQYGISALVLKTAFRGEIVGDLAKC